MPIAQLNIAESLYPMDDTRMAGFTDNIEQVNALADRSSGFIWRLVDDSDQDGALLLRLPGSDTTLVNMSVWTDIESLFAYMYKTVHAKIMRERQQWFSTLTTHHLVLWYVAEGHIPSLEEARERLDHLKQNGPTPYAFTFSVPFNEDGVPVTPNFPKKDCA